MERFSKILQMLGRVIVGLIGFVIVILILHFGFVKLQQYGNTLIVPADQMALPYIHLGDQHPVDVLHPNQFFFVHVDAVRTKPCTVSRYYRILSTLPDRDSKHSVVWLTYPESISNTQAGTYEGDTLLRLPSWLPVGDYQLDRYAVFTCDGLKIDPASRMPFRVEMPVNNDLPMMPSATP